MTGPTNYWLIALFKHLKIYGRADNTQRTRTNRISSRASDSSNLGPPTFMFVTGLTCLPSRTSSWLPTIQVDQTIDSSIKPPLACLFVCLALSLMLLLRSFKDEYCENSGFFALLWLSSIVVGVVCGRHWFKLLWRGARTNRRDQEFYIRRRTTGMKKITYISRPFFISFLRPSDINPPFMECFCQPRTWSRH